MKVKELIKRIEEFQKKLLEHKRLWGSSLDKTIPDYPIRNVDQLETQSRLLCRSLGTLRPFLDRFFDSWIMGQPASRTTWDALESAVSLQSVALAKGPSMRIVSERLDQILGKLEAYDKEDEIPKEPTQPIKPGIGLDSRKEKQMRIDLTLQNEILSKLKDIYPESGEIAELFPNTHDDEHLHSNLFYLEEKGLIESKAKRDLHGAPRMILLAKITAPGINFLEQGLSHSDVPKEEKAATETFKKPNAVFIVHGHDDALLQQTARLLEKMEVEPIILFERAGKSQTIIEKLESHSSVSFAVVLFTPDDVGKGAKEEGNPRPRARQNVVLELGYFIGKLGRSNVILIYSEGVELPSDYHGVEHIKLDPEGAWKIKLAKELKEAGLNIDMNKAI